MESGLGWGIKLTNMSYIEGAHDSPADTRDRLVRIGSKYQATAPTVADGDNAYLLLDSAGRLLIAGGAAHDAAALGNPVRIGGVPHRHTRRYRRRYRRPASGRRRAVEAGFHPRHLQVNRRRGRHRRDSSDCLDPGLGEKGAAAGLVFVFQRGCGPGVSGQRNSGTVIAQTPLLAAAGVHGAPALGEGLVLATADNTLNLDVTINSTVSGMVFGIEE